MTDVYLLIMDCLRQDIIDLDIDGKPLMPNLRRFRDSSFEFTNAFASAPSTHFAVPTILTGLLPYTIDGNQGIHEKAPYLPVAFKEEGFRTLGYTTNAVTSHIFGYSRGFDIYRDFLDSEEISSFYRFRKKLIYRIEKAPPGKRRLYDLLMIPVNLLTKITGWKLNPEDTNFKIKDIFDGKNILDSFEADIDLSRDDRYFSFLHFVDTHAPYAPPESFMEGFVEKRYRKRRYLEDFFKMVYEDERKVMGEPDLRERNWQLYLASCSYQDHLFARFLETLKKEPRDRESLIIVMSDHGEAFGEHGYLQHKRTRFSRPHNRIPLIIGGSGIDPGSYDGFIDETDLFSLIRSMAFEKAETSNPSEMVDEKESILTLGYSGTYSLTNRRSRFISDDEGERIFRFDDEDEKEPAEVDDEMSRFFRGRKERIRKMMKGRIDQKYVLSSSIRSMQIGKNK